MMRVMRRTKKGIGERIGKRVGRRGKAVRKVRRASI